MAQESFAGKRMLVTRRGPAMVLNGIDILRLIGCEYFSRD